MRKKNILITMGDPAGCGPYITLKAVEFLSGQEKYKNTNFVVFGDKEVLRKISLYRRVSRRFILRDLKNSLAGKVRPGYPSRITGIAALSYLDAAINEAKKENCGIVTAPVSKEAVGMVVPGFSGHTEYLAGVFKVKYFEMMMVAGGLRIVLLTRHVPLSSVSRLITPAKLTSTFKLVYNALKDRFKIESPKIAMGSFNPHAGIETFLGREEKIMSGAIAGFPRKIFGPYPADTVFLPENIKKYDCLISPCHDQGMIAFKLMAFRNGVNLTIGLPVVRTSPAHGTAFGLIRSGKKPYFSSMVEAIKLAEKLAR